MTLFKNSKSLLYHIWLVPSERWDHGLLWLQSVPLHHPVHEKDLISFLWSCHNSATGCKIVKTGTVYLYSISILAETLSLHHCILLIYYNCTWKCEMMYHIRPSVSLGFPSTMSSLLMLTGRTYTNKCTLVNKFSKNWVSWRLLLVWKLF